MNRSYSKIRHIQESNQKLEERLLGEQTTTFASVFPSVNMLTTTDLRTRPLMGGTDGTNIIYLTKRDVNGKPIPNTKFSYKLSGSYKFFTFDITLRKVSRNAAGELVGEVLPNNGFVKKAMQTLIGKQHLTPDGWLKIAAPREKINQALVQLHNNKGSSAKMKLNGGVDIELEQV
jgi:hypothetical protein